MKLISRIVNVEFLLWMLNCLIISEADLRSKTADSRFALCQ